jgi:hypothetical protein
LSGPCFGEKGLEHELLTDVTHCGGYFSWFLKYQQVSPPFEGGRGVFFKPGKAIEKYGMGCVGPDKNLRRRSSWSTPPYPPQGGTFMREVPGQLKDHRGGA